MISDNELHKIKQDFEAYVADFSSPEKAFQQNIEVKKKHSREVMKNAAHLAEALNLERNDIRLASVIGILHDIGRFEQFKKYHTFSDKKSENHALLSVKVINRDHLINDLDMNEQDLVKKAIACHNMKEIPGNLTEREQLFCNLIRDADKLDIWRVVTDYYCQMEEEPNNALQLDLPDTPGYSKVNLQDIMEERIVDLQNLQNLNDFKLLQVGWIYDLNFKESLGILKERGYMKTLLNTLPDDEELIKMKARVKQYLNQS